MPPTVEVWSPNHCTAREVPHQLHLDVGPSCGNKKAACCNQDYPLSYSHLAEREKAFSHISFKIEYNFLRSFPPTFSCPIAVGYRSIWAEGRYQYRNDNQSRESA